MTTVFIFILFGIESCKSIPAQSVTTMKNDKIVKEKIEYLSSGDHGNQDAPVLSKISYYDRSGQLIKEKRFISSALGRGAEQIVSVSVTSVTAPDLQQTVKTVYRSDQWNFYQVELRRYDRDQNLLSMEIMKILPDSTETVKKCTYSSRDGKIENESCTVFLTDQQRVGKYSYDQQGRLKKVIYFDSDAPNATPILEETMEFLPDGSIHKIITNNLLNNEKILMRTLIYEYYYW